MAAAALLVFILIVASASGGGGSGSGRGHHHPAPARHASTRVYVRPKPGPGGMYWGAGIKNQLGQAPWQMAALHPFTARAGKQVSVISWGSQFYSSANCSGWCTFQTSRFQTVRNYGAIPMLSWGPNWKPQIDKQIADGNYDAYLTRWARGAKAWGHPLFLRFAWEMNGSWFPWSVGKTGVSTEGNTPATYVAMWRHVHDLFQHVGARNVTWVWCPNVDAPTTYEPVDKLYPGNAYVNWTCLDGYNGNNPWHSFKQLFGRSYTQITIGLAPHKPMMIGEVASTETGGSKPDWISNMFDALRTNFPKIHGLIWYDVISSGPGGHADWPIESSSGSVRAFSDGVSASSFRANSFAHLNTSPIPAP